MFQVSVAICIDGGETASITFTGVGYDKRLMGDTMNVGDASHLTGVPSLQRQVLPGQVNLLDNYPLSIIPRWLGSVMASYRHRNVFNRLRVRLPAMYCWVCSLLGWVTVCGQANHLGM